MMRYRVRRATPLLTISGRETGEPLFYFLLWFSMEACYLEDIPAGTIIGICVESLLPEPGTVWNSICCKFSGRGKRNLELSDYKTSALIHPLYRLSLLAPIRKDEFSINLHKPTALYLSPTLQAHRKT